MKTTRTTAVGVFQDRQQAQQAINDLRKAGFQESQIGVAVRDGEQMTGAGNVSDDRGSNVAAGAATGTAAGAGVGALWGIGVLAGLLPALGPVIAGGTLAALLGSAAIGAAAAGIAGALIGLGIPKDEADYYESEFQSGRTVVTVRADNRYDEACAILRRNHGYDYSTKSERNLGATGATTSSTGQAASATSKTVQAHEEQLHVHKQPVQTGEAIVRKEVHTETKTVQVPVKKEEIVVERHAVSGHPAAGGDIKAGEEIRIPVSEEQVHVEKRPVVTEEVTVGKRQVQDTEEVAGTVRKEEIKVEKKGNVDVKDKSRR